MNSSIAEVIAAYAPPMAAPVAKRNSRKLQKSRANAVATDAAR
jgi:hypothetical protein